MKPSIFLLLLLQTGVNLFAADSLQVTAPGKKISVTIYCTKK
jgi:hypothetical protein